MQSNSEATFVSCCGQMILLLALLYYVPENKFYKTFFRKPTSCWAAPKSNMSIGKIAQITSYIVFAFAILLWIAAKIHTYTHLDLPFGTFVSMHWLYWAGILGCGIALFLLGKLFDSSGSGYERKA